MEGRKIEVIRSIAEKLGPVEDIKTETRGAAAVAVCKAKVILDLQSPLEPGMIYSYKGKEIWIDFRYERLPVFCFSCGRIGHYAQNCLEVPYDEEKFARNENIYYGTWLKTEMNSPSPYWKSFYEKPAVEEMEEEIIPETQDSPNQGKEGGEVRKKQPGVDKGKRKMNELVGNTSNRELELFKDSTASTTRLLLDLPSIHGTKSREQDKMK